MHKLTKMLTSLVLVHLPATMLIAADLNGERSKH
jgi:hypothetical protein